ncbi:MAG: hypothetical protein FWD48_01145 [Oscillospiraceae bacterium]|nr:hypothetical protein [Oscillospiraceae bacterium]
MPIWLEQIFELSKTNIGNAIILAVFLTPIIILTIKKCREDKPVCVEKNIKEIGKAATKKSNQNVVLSSLHSHPCGSYFNEHCIRMLMNRSDIYPVIATFNESASDYYNQDLNEALMRCIKICGNSYETEFARALLVKEICDVNRKRISKFKEIKSSRIITNCLIQLLIDLNKSK